MHIFLWALGLFFGCWLSWGVALFTVGMDMAALFLLPFVPILFALVYLFATVIYLYRR